MSMMILMNCHHVEPISLLDPRFEELDFAIPKCPKKTLVSDIAHSVQCQLSLTLLQQDWLHLYIVRLECSAEIVKKPRNLQQIKRAEVSIASRVVMITMNRE